MPPVLSKIEDFANNIAAAYTTTHIVPRGVPRFVDQALKGTLKFSRRIGNVLPTIQPQNQVTLTQNSSVLQTTLRVNSILPGFMPNALIRVDHQEILKISDVDSALNLISLTDELLVPYTAGVQVDLFGTPVFVYGPVAPGSVIPAGSTSTLYIRSPHRIVTGDQLYIQQDVSLLLSGTDFTVVEAVQIGTVSSDFIVMVTLDNPIPRNLELNATVYLRTFPGYYSPKVSIPAHRRRPMYTGPFVIDYVSGRFDDGDDIVETLDIQAYDAAGVPFLGTTPPVTSTAYFARAQKNFPVLAVPIHASSFIFWDVIRGKINYRPDAFILTTDSEGRAVISTELAPAWSGTQTWICQAQGENATFGSVYYRFAPNPESFAGSISLVAPTTLEFTLSGQSSNRIEIVFVGPPNASIRWNSWFPAIRNAGPPVTYTDRSIASIQYTLSARVNGASIWQAGSLMAKPYFNVAADIQGVSDFDSFDNGSVML